MNPDHPETLARRPGHTRRKIRELRAWRAGLILALLTALAACGGTSPAPMSKLGIFEPGVPRSYTPVANFTAAAGVRPNLDVYYSGWYEPFRAAFAAAAARHGAEALVQIDPAGIDLAAIAAGTYDSYLRSYAGAVRAYGHPVILSFGHEMNASWYSWGLAHTAPATFVAAWRHIVGLFRTAGASNVTWLWTVNVTGSSQAGPIAPWWPGNSYVTWVGLDGYFFQLSQTFRTLFGPTIAAVRALTGDPVLIAETGATPTAGKPAKIASLFAGAHRYGLIGFVWFDADTEQNWRVSHDPPAIAALRAGVAAYMKPVPGFARQ